MNEAINITNSEFDLLLKLARKMYFSKDVIKAFYEQATKDQLEALIKVIHMEVEIREVHKRSRLLRKASFPCIKSFEGFDFSNIAFPDGYTAQDLQSLDFIEKAQDFVFHGPTGRGKTHLAIAIGIACINNAKRVRFFTVAQLGMALKQAKQNNTLEKFMKEFSKLDLLILDELGYVPLDIEGARLLFQVMSGCYEKCSMVITTNIEFGKWGTVFGDDKLAAAIIDRIVHHGRLVEFNGASYRMSSALMLGDRAAVK